MTTTCPRHNNVMQFLYVSKNCQVTWLKSSTFWKKSYFNFDLNVFFMKELKGAILAQNHRRSQGVAQGTRAPSIEMPPMTKACQKSLVSSFLVSFSNFAYNSTLVQQQFTINNVDDQETRRIPTNSSFSNQFKHITKVKLRVFVLKVATSSSHLNFL